MDGLYQKLEEVQGIRSTWLTQHRARVSGKSPLCEALKYIAKYWNGLTLFLADRRVEMDSNAVERHPTHRAEPKERGLRGA